MCLIALAWDAHPRWDLVLAANRDEFLDRPAAPLQRHADGSVGGRDLHAGGTWLGLHEGGRLATVTNIRRPGAARDDAPSRGSIVPQWLHGGQAAPEFCATLAAQGYNPFNLIAGDLRTRELFWTSSEQPAPHVLPPGLHGLSNDALDTPWPKLQRLKAALALALETGRDADTVTQSLLQALQDRHRPDDAELPATGVTLELERGLAPVFIDLPHYGTRCSTVLLRERGSGHTLVVERSHAPQPGEVRLELARWGCC